jgi:hypothetical protein
LLVLVPAAIAKFNKKGRDVTKLKKDETVASLLCCYYVHTVAALRKEFFLSKRQKDWGIRSWMLHCYMGAGSRYPLDPLILFMVK